MDSLTTEYAAWLDTLRPRTCLLVHWLANMGAVRDPGQDTREKARRFAEKRLLLGRLVDNRGGEIKDRTGWLLDNGEFDLYVSYLMWLRFVEYVPSRFVLPGGREQVLSWVRTQLRRPELTDSETVGELQWQVSRLRKSWGPSDEIDHWKENPQ